MNRISKHLNKRQGADSQESVGVPSYPESDFGRTFLNPCRPSLLWEGVIKANANSLTHFMIRYNSGEKEKRYQLFGWFFLREFVCFVNRDGHTLVILETE